jgi:hypothetical protein
VSTETSAPTIEPSSSIANEQPAAMAAVDSRKAVTWTVEPSSQATNEELASEATPEPVHANFYAVADYDEDQDPSDDLAKTIARAEAENKRVILQVGGEWCGWCKLITNYMSTNATVRSHLEKNFLIMKVTYPGKNANDFLANYPQCQGYPHLFVLEKNGDLLHSQGTGELEKGHGYDDEVFMAFLNNWTR